jgi:hypothetical protein
LQAAALLSFHLLCHEGTITYQFPGKDMGVKNETMNFRFSIPCTKIKLLHLWPTDCSNYCAHFFFNVLFHVHHLYCSQDTQLKWNDKCRSCVSAIGSLLMMDT